MAKKTAKKQPRLPEKLVKYLEETGIKHKILEHKTVYTAFDAATTMKRKIGEMAKSLLVKADKDYYLVLLPADYNLDMAKLGKYIKDEAGKSAKVIKIPGEKIMTEVFKIKAGTIGAFGGFRQLPVIMDNNLAKIKKAVFSSGSFNHSVEMGVKDFIKLEKAVLGNFGIKKKVKKVLKKKK